MAGDPFVTEEVVARWSITGWQGALAPSPDAAPASPSMTASTPVSAGVRFDRVAPVVPVLELDAALQRYADLGFDVHADEGPDRYGFADRGGVSLHLTEWDQHDPKRTAAQVYLYVDDADALHAEWRASGVPGRLTDPTDTPYGLREFAFVDDDGTLHRVGSPLAP